MPEKFECPDCHKSFDTRRGLHIHIGEMHPEEKEVLFQKEKEINSESKDILNLSLKDKKVLAGIFLLLLIASLFFYQYHVSNPVVVGEEISADETGRILVEAFIDRSDIGEENIELLDSQKTDSEVHRLEVSVNGEKIVFFTTLDGTKFFLDYYIVEDKIDGFDKKDAGETVVKNLEKELSEKVEEYPQIRNLSVDYGDVEEEKSRIYMVETIFQANDLPAEKTKSYITRDGKYVFLEGFKTNKFEEITLLPN